MYGLTGKFLVDIISHPSHRYRPHPEHYDQAHPGLPTLAHMRLPARVEDEVVPLRLIKRGLQGVVVVLKVRRQSPLHAAAAQRHVPRAHDRVRHRLLLHSPRA